MDALLTTYQAAEILQLDPGTLCNWRSCRTGPPFVRVGRAVRYRRSDLERFVRAGAVSH